MTLPSTIVEELTEVCDRLRTHFALWRELRSTDCCNKYQTELEDNCELFESIAEAHLAATILAVCQLMEESDDVLSFPNLLSTLRGTHSGIVAAIETRMFPHREIFLHIHRIRSKVYAHRDSDLGPEMVFAAAPITPDSLGACVDVLQWTASELCFATQLSTHPGTVYDTIDASAAAAVGQLHGVLEALSNTSLERTREG